MPAQVPFRRPPRRRDAAVVVADHRVALPSAQVEAQALEHHSRGRGVGRLRRGPGLHRDTVGGGHRVASLTLTSPSHWNTIRAKGSSSLLKSIEMSRHRAKHL